MPCGRAHPGRLNSIVTPPVCLHVERLARELGAIVAVVVDHAARRSVFTIPFTRNEALPCPGSDPPLASSAVGFLVLELPQLPDLVDLQAAVHLLHHQSASSVPSLRIRSATGKPAPACFNTATTCSTKNCLSHGFRFTASTPLPARRFCRKLALHVAQLHLSFSAGHGGRWSYSCLAARRGRECDYHRDWGDGFIGGTAGHPFSAQSCGAELGNPTELMGMGSQPPFAVSR